MPTMNDRNARRLAAASAAIEFAFAAGLDDAANKIVADIMAKDVLIRAAATGQKPLAVLEWGLAQMLVGETGNELEETRALNEELRPLVIERMKELGGEYVLANEENKEA